MALGLVVPVLVALAGCGGAGSSATPSDPSQPLPAASHQYRLVVHGAAGQVITLGATSYSLDQLAPPPEVQPGAPVLLAVIRASTTGPATHLHVAGISLIDDRGGRWAAVRIPTYVAIDALENAPIEPNRGAAGTVAFRLPPGRRGVAVSVQSRGEEALLDAPQ